MKKSQRLKVVLEIAERNESEALKKMQSVRNQMQLEIQRLNEFIAYREDYQQQLKTASMQSMATGQYINFQNFIAQLGNAIKQQQQKIALVEQHLKQLTAQWRLCHEKTRGMAGHIDQCKAEEQREVDAREQRALDELSQSRNAFRSHDN